MRRLSCDDRRASRGSAACRSKRRIASFGPLYLRARRRPLNVAGRETAANSIINLAGGVNAIRDYDGDKASGPAAPDFILMTSRGLESSGGVDELLKLPGLDLTPAGKALSLPVRASAQS